MEGRPWGLELRAGSSWLLWSVGWSVSGVCCSRQPSTDPPGDVRFDRFRGRRGPFLRRNWRTNGLEFMTYAPCALAPVSGVWVMATVGDGQLVGRRPFLAAFLEPRCCMFSPGFEVLFLGLHGARAELTVPVISEWRIALCGPRGLLPPPPRPLALLDLEQKVWGRRLSSSAWSGTAALRH